MGHNSLEGPPVILRIIVMIEKQGPLTRATLQGVTKSSIDSYITLALGQGLICPVALADRPSGIKSGRRKYKLYDITERAINLLDDYRGLLKRGGRYPKKAG